MKRVLIIADDLTGANDVGCQVFANGFRCQSLDASHKELNKTLKNFAGITIINTSSRLLAPKAAYDKVATVLKKTEAKAKSLIYKKIDSTLRGNLGAEIDACIDGLNLKAVALIPAFPALGRKTINGRHYINGKLLEASVFAKDPVNPAKTSDISALLKEQSKYRSVSINIATLRKGLKGVKAFIRKELQQTPVIFIFDCCATSDLNIIAKAVKDFKLVAGASALAGYLTGKKKKEENKYPKAGKNSAYLIGSANEITHSQIKELVSKNKCSLFNILNTEKMQFSKDDLILSVHAKKTAFRKDTRLRIETAFRKTAIRLIEKDNYGNLVISGGATAETVLNALKISLTELKDIIITGVPLTYSPKHNIYIVTKPGGFGSKGALLKIRRRLKLLIAD